MSPYSILLKPGAQEDIAAATAYYETEKRGLGLQFLDHLDAAIRSISLYPESHPIIHRDLRQQLTRKFPFRVFYRIQDNTIEIFGVLHQSRRYDRLLRKRL